MSYIILRIQSCIVISGKMAMMAKMAKIDPNIYMADGTLVQDIYISNVPQDISVEDIQKYYGQFGKVSKIKLQLKGPANLVGYINFVEPLAAAKALVTREHFISPYRERIMIEPCGRWYPLSILCLNDDCLLQICKYLGLRDQLSLAIVHSRCAAALQKQKNRGEHKDDKIVDFKELSQMTSCQVEEFFRIFPVEEIKGNGDRSVIGDVIVDAMKKHCNNGKLLQLSNCRILRGRLFEILQRMQQITKLVLSNCLLEDEKIPDMPNLTTLEIRGCRMRGELLAPRLPTVQHFCFEFCSPIQPHFVIEAIKSMKMVQYIQFLSYRNLSNYILQEIAENCHKVEALKIPFQRYANYECVAQLPNLKTLVVYREYEEPPVPMLTLLKVLVQYKAHQLEYLSLKGNFRVGRKEVVELGLLQQLKHLTCTHCVYLNDRSLRELTKLKSLEELKIYSYDITDDGLLYFLEQCTKLMLLDIIGCMSITDSFAYHAIDVLRSVTAQRNGPVVMNVYLTRITQSILKEPEFTDTASLLELNFCPLPRDFVHYSR